MLTEPPDPSAGPAIERLRLLFRQFGSKQCRGRSPVYETLSEAVASDDGLLGLLLATPGDQRRPSLLFAAYYPVHGGRRPVDDELAPAAPRPGRPLPALARPGSRGRG